MGGGNTKEKPKEKEKRDHARTMRAIENAIETGAARLDLNNRHIRELPETIEGKKDALKWLSLSHNELKALSETVCQFVNLTALRLNSNQLSSLPDAITTLTALTVIDLSKNKFTEWDPRLSAITQLTDLNLQCNQIGSLPRDFSKLPHLRHLNLYINSITNFEVDWSGLTSLTNLDLSFNGLKDESLTTTFQLPALTFLPLCGNKLTTIPTPILALPALKLLDLRFNRLEIIPEDLGAMASCLRTLRLSNNCLRALPSSFSQLVALEELDLSSNQLEDLENIQGLSKLTSLHVYWNKLKGLPEDFGNLVELRDLFIIDNEICSLPDSMSKLVNLRTFMAHYNQLPSIPIPMVSTLSSLTVLNLSENNLTSLPTDLSALKSLSRLDLRANIISELPSSLGEVKSLAFLEMGDNNLLSVPPIVFELTSLNGLNLFSNGIYDITPAIANLKHLTGLNLSFNQLTFLPAELATMVTLVHLRLEGNFFKEFPDSIVSLTALKELAIGSNRQIKEIPSSISQLASLTTFQASSNQIHALPDTFVLLKSLTELDLSHNRLSALPTDMDRLTGLTDLDISGNALTRIPPCFGNMRSLQQVKASFNPGLLDVPSEYLKAPKTWISCTGNSKIESEYYFARKKGFDKTGRWQPTTEEDTAPVDPQITPLSYSTSSLGSSAMSTSPSSPTSILSSPARSPADSPSILSPITEIDSPREHHPQPAITLSEYPQDEENKKDPATPTATSSLAQDKTAAGKNEKGDRLSSSGGKGSKKHKDKKHPMIVATHDFHTPSILDDRRLTIVTSEDSVDHDESSPGNGKTTSHEYYSAPASLNASSSSVSSKKDSEGRKDKKKDKDDKKRDKDIFASLNSIVGDMVMRTPQVGWAEMRGSRPDMQDSLVIMEHFQSIRELTLIGLFDGHGGTETALLTAKKLPILMLESMRQVLDARGLDLNLNALLSLSHADLAIIIRAAFMALHGAVTKAGYTDGTAASVGLVLHHYGATPKTPTPPQAMWTTHNLNVIYGDEVYHDNNVAGWCEKGRAAQILLSNPPTSAIAQSNPAPLASTSSSGPNSVTSSATSSNVTSGTSPQSAPMPIPHAGPHSRDWLVSVESDDASTGSSSRPETPITSSGEFLASHASTSSGKSKKGKGHVLPAINVGRSLFVLGNCGDQRAVLCRRGQAFPLTKDHKPENPSELARITRSGGFVAETRRVDGLLALSRAIGDVGVQPHVTFEPDIIVTELTEHDEFIILACDGVWDVLSSEQAVYLALAESSPSRAANRIREYAYSLGSTDNISVIVHHLKQRDRSNFGTSVLTHINESMAIQASSPRKDIATTITITSPTPGTVTPAPQGTPISLSPPPTPTTPTHGPPSPREVENNSTQADHSEGPSVASAPAHSPLSAPQPSPPQKKRKKAKSNLDTSSYVAEKESKDSKEKEGKDKKVVQ